MYIIRATRFWIYIVRKTILLIKLWSRKIHCCLLWSVELYGLEIKIEQFKLILNTFMVVAFSGGMASFIGTENIIQHLKCSDLCFLFK